MIPIFILGGFRWSLKVHDLAVRIRVATIWEFRDSEHFFNHFLRSFFFLQAQNLLDCFCLNDGYHAAWATIHVLVVKPVVSIDKVSEAFMMQHVSLVAHKLNHRILILHLIRADSACQPTQFVM